MQTPTPRAIQTPTPDTYCTPKGNIKHKSMAQKQLHPIQYKQLCPGQYMNLHLGNPDSSTPQAIKKTSFRATQTAKSMAIQKATST